MPLPNARPPRTPLSVDRVLKEAVAASSPLPRAWGRATPEEETRRAREPLARGILAIAASTGGPQEVAHILKSLPAGFPYAVVIAQHIAPGFAGGLARWLGRHCALPVVLARGGEPLVAGVVYVSPTERNLIVAPNRHTELVDPVATDFYHPSCDTLLSSAARVYGRRCIGVILSGMGADGAEGLGAIRAAGGTTFAQNEETSVVFGMNGVAVKRGAAQYVMPSGRIADMVIQRAAM